MLISKLSQVHDHVDIKINDIRIEQGQSMKFWAYTNIETINFSGMSSVANFVLMFQAKYCSCIELDHFVVQIYEYT